MTTRRPRPPSTPEPELSEDDRRLLDEAMAGVRRIESGPIRPRPAPSPRPATPSVPSRPPLAVSSSGGIVAAFDPGVPPPTRRALARGEPPPEVTIDLHGLRAAEAERRVAAALQAARAEGRRCLLVITGRGLRSGREGPVLRERIAATLAGRADDVLGFTSAPPDRGGTGAFLVLLRRDRGPLPSLVR